MPNIEQRIEEYLLEAAGDGWVNSKVLCAAFDVTERQLRKVGDQEGLCSAFAISGDKGFKHVALAARLEWLRFKHRMRKHAIAELIRVRDLDRRRNQITKTIKRPIFVAEKDTGQGILLNVPADRYY
ncbi:MAG: hypothetical protein K9M45_12805 [Kiritimatiellales bacterium]|nr:hypothetical protein [Kiritimatiellales bacterium]